MSFRSGPIVSIGEACARWREGVTGGRVEEHRPSIGVLPTVVEESIAIGVDPPLAIVREPSQIEENPAILSAGEVFALLSSARDGERTR